MYKKLNILLMGSLFILLMAGCTKYNDWSTDDAHKRLFSPLTLTATVEGVIPTLKWKTTPGTKSFTIELSKDSLMFTNIVKTYETEGVVDADGGGLLFVVPDLLDASSRYSARIKGKGTGITESNWTIVTFLTLTEQIMQSVDIADIEPKAVTLRWNTPNQVTHFMIGASRYDVTAPEAAAGVKKITGLTPKTTYTATLYNNASIRGTQTFATKADIPTGSNVIEVKSTDDLAAMLATSVPAGTIFVLLQGSLYKTDATITLPENSSFTIWGEDGPAKPVLAFNGITLPLNAGTIKFENVDITGYQDNNSSGTKRNYIFNQSTASNTEAIVFENCIVRNFVNTPFRLQGSNTITVNKLTFNKCISYDIGDNNSNGTYAFIHTNVATGKVNNIEITNSTIYKIGYGLILHNLAPSATVNISNCTFNNTIGNGRYFIDYNAQAVTTLFKFENNIFGKTLAQANTGRGVRAGSTMIVNNSYQTSDATVSANPFPGITAYSKASTDLFTDPDNGNFLIKDNGFAGKSSSGDPRWR